MKHSHDKNKSTLTILERIAILIITATLIVLFFVVKEYWKLSFGWNSLELGVLLIILFIIAFFIPTEKKKTGQ